MGRTRTKNRKLRNSNLDCELRTTNWTMANPQMPRQDFLSSVENLQNLVQNMNIEAKPNTSNVPSDPQEPQPGLLRCSNLMIGPDQNQVFYSVRGQNGKLQQYATFCLDDIDLLLNSPTQP